MTLLSKIVSVKQMVNFRILFPFKILNSVTVQIDEYFQTNSNRGPFFIIKINKIIDISYRYLLLISYLCT